MDIQEIIGRQRELYLRDLLDFYKGKSGGVREIMLELNNDEPIRQFKLYRLDHYDQVEGVSKPTELNSDKYLDFEPIEYKYEDLNVELNPFYWNGCEFVLDSNSIDSMWLIEWTKKWIDENDEKQENADGLTGVIHNVSRPTRCKDTFSFTIDFGSAETESFIDLINEIYLQDVKFVRVGSFSMMNPSNSA
jgi:hypothetical protein